MIRFTKMQSVLVFAFFCLAVFAAVIYMAGDRHLGARMTIIDNTVTQPAKTGKTLSEDTAFYTGLNLSASNLNGLKCKNHNRRPFAVMIAEDAEARDLSGISLADLVIEMPVVTGSITRMMALFVCEDPKEIGSVRSVRHDFIPLALGYDSILAHWGGSRIALEELDKGVIDNLDAMVNYYNSFYRKSWIPAPHNGFTSMERLLSAAGELEYRMESRFEGYRFVENPKSRSASQRTNLKPLSTTVTIGYRYPYNVEYKYSAEKDSYLRWRAGKKEIDALTNKQAEAKNIAVMRTASRQIGGGYNDVDVTGTGEAAVYRNGLEIKGTWTKKTAKDALIFFDEEGGEISFTPGTIWIEIVDQAELGGE